MKRLDQKGIFDKIEEWICLAMMILMFFSIGINIILYWAFGLRLGKLEELGTSAYMFCCYAAFGWMYKNKDLTEVTFVVNTFKPKQRWFSELFRYVFLVFFGALVTVRAVQLCGNSIVKKLPALQIPYIYLDSSIVLGFFLLTVRALKDTVKHILTAREVFSKRE